MVEPLMHWMLQYVENRCTLHGCVKLSMPILGWWHKLSLLECYMYIVKYAVTWHCCRSRKGCRRTWMPSTLSLSTTSQWQCLMPSYNKFSTLPKPIIVMLPRQVTVIVTNSHHPSAVSRHLCVISLLSITPAITCEPCLIWTRWENGVLNSSVIFYVV